MQTLQSTGFAWSHTSLSFVIGYHFFLLGRHLHLTTQLLIIQCLLKRAGNLLLSLCTLFHSQQRQPLALYTIAETGDFITNKYPPAKPGVLHRRVKPWITSARVTSRWYGLPAAKDCYLPPVNGPFRSFPLLAVRLPGLLLTGAGCILLSFFRFSLLYPHSILCTRTPYCDT